MFYDGKSVGHIFVKSTFNFDNVGSISADLEKKVQSKEEEIANLKKMLQEAEEREAEQKRKIEDVTA